MKKNWLKMLAATLVGAMLLFGCGQSDSNEESADVQKESLQETSVASSEVESSVTESQTQEETEESEEPNYDIIPESFAYSLTVSINPLVELYFDADNTVVGVSYLNQDAVDAYKEVELVGSSLEQGMDLLVNAAADKGYIKEDATVEIELAKVSEEAEETFDSTILVEASQIVNEVLVTVSEEKEIALEATVEVKVNAEVEEKVGVKAPVVCSDCNGTGNSCKECNGTGIVNCKRCVNGVESCGTCHGTAIINCHGCKGAGGDCNHCDGSGKISCDACGGQGTFLCSWCKGALRHICPDCWDEGTCSTCGGDGII